ncbi:regulatory protein TetR [Sphingobium chlorophenolicum L-1]|uniref:Regulatory protein TetR n=1 Tax=Sphingobium chlorophenolicum L-1 TaxID=690566 RepID=F6EUQ9_SPHCR|nr:TetR family transcriptional regulator [Sphingobium chlorophenolicum]AEG48777.1 regulatory protein TetR [Sphingobium chlorophenolicum L-1]
MRVSRKQAEMNREHVIDVASRLFREHGFDGIGLDDLMKGAGLTRGAFYGQFPSKAALAEEASERALTQSVNKLADAVSADADRPVSTLANYYLSVAHRDFASGGCALAALASDAAREGDGVRSKFTEGVEAHLELFEDVLSSSPRRADFDDAAVALSTLVGALILARAVNDETLSRRILAAAARAVADDFSSEKSART